MPSVPRNPLDDTLTGSLRPGAEPILLGLLSVVGYFLLYTLNIFLARSLTREEFNDYNVGVSSLLLLAAFAPLGLEKLTLKVVPVHLHHAAWGRLRGFLRFALLTTLVVSITLSLLVDTALESVLLLNHFGSHPAIPMIVGCLPLLSIFSVLLEAVTASGAAIAAAALYRVGAPLLMLIFNVAAWGLVRTYSGGAASLSFLAAWLSVTIAMVWLLHKQLPVQKVELPPQYEARKWLRQSTPLLVHGLLMTAITQSGVILLELSPTFHADASVYAVAMQTGAFIVLFSTSANRYYLPRVAVLLKYQDRDNLLRLMRQRLWLFGGVCAGFFAIVVVCAPPLLRAHGPGFEQGYLATCVIAAGAAVSTMLSLSPFGLQFAGQQQYVLRRMLVAMLVSIAGCVLLANRYGALGAAIAYAVPLIVLHLTLANKARRLLVGTV